MLNDQSTELKEPKSIRIISAIVFALALLIGAWVRFHDIGIKPFHHDEGVNSYFLLNLAKQGVYRYDPTNYHGPSLYYLALMTVRILGENDFSLRFWPAFFGTLTIGMIWVFRRHLGSVGTPVAAFCIALSPGLVYFSRDFIHEMSFGCFSLGIVIGAWKYAETKKFAWLGLLSASAGLLFATKETAIITAIVLIVAIICATVWDVTRQLMSEGQFSLSALVGGVKRDVVSILPSLDHSLAAIILFLFINIFLYSSVFTNWQGVTDAVKSIFLWNRRKDSEHVKSFWYYLGILIKLEWPLLVGALLAGGFAVWRGARFWLFTGAWTLGMTLAYSKIGYKTPWLMISFLVPMALVSGYAAQQVYQSLRPISLKVLWSIIILTAMIYCGRLTMLVNFEKYDDNSNLSGYFTAFGEKQKLKPYIDGQYGYVYAQTDRDFYHLVQAIKDETDKLPTNNHTGIYIASPDYWPLPWYLRDFDQVAYTGSLNVIPGEPPVITQPIVIANASQETRLDGLPGWRRLDRSFTLRPGVELVIYLHEDEMKKEKASDER